MVQLPTMVVSPDNPVSAVREVALVMLTSPPTHCRRSSPVRFVSVAPLTVKLPLIHVVPAFWNAVNSPSVEIATFPGLVVPAQGNGAISTSHVPALHLGRA